MQVEIVKCFVVRTCVREFASSTSTTESTEYFLLENNAVEECEKRNKCFEREKDDQAAKLRSVGYSFDGRTYKTAYVDSAHLLRAVGTDDYFTLGCQVMCN